LLIIACCFGIYLCCKDKQTKTEIKKNANDSLESARKKDRRRSTGTLENDASKQEFTHHRLVVEDTDAGQDDSSSYVAAKQKADLKIKSKIRPESAESFQEPSLKVKVIERVQQHSEEDVSFRTK